MISITLKTIQSEISNINGVITIDQLWGNKGRDAIGGSVPAINCFIRQSI